MLAAIHHAANALGHIATGDHQAVRAAADNNRLYVPIRLLPSRYDIPQRYTQAPDARLETLKAAYDSVIAATTHATARLDDLAITTNAPSSVLATARRESATTPPASHHHQDQQPAARARTATATTVRGQTEQALLKLQIRDPALLLRAAVIDQAAHDLVAEATATHTARSSALSSSPSAQLVRQGQGTQAARLASQDAPLTPAPERLTELPSRRTVSSLRQVSPAQNPGKVRAQSHGPQICPRISDTLRVGLPLDCYASATNAYAALPIVIPARTAILWLATTS